MAIRKTREQLDAEMSRLPPAGDGEAPPPPPAEDAASLAAAAERELPDEYAGEAAEGDAPGAVGPAPASELEFVQEEGVASDPAGEPAGEDVLGGAETAPRPEQSEEPAPLLPPVEDPAAAEGEEVEARLLPRIKGVVESLLFVAGEPLPVSALLGLVRELQPGLSGRALRGVLDGLRDELREAGRGVRLAEVAGGYQLRTPSEFSPVVRKLITRRPPRMTRPTLETLAIIAYRQPVTRPEVEDIRGVDSGPVLKHLLEKRLVRILGRKEEVGRPLIYGTTKEFLEFFSLKDLKSLPTLKDFVELSDEHRAQLGLEAREAAAAEGAEPAAPDLLPVATDEYSPVGEDEVLQELSQALDELKSRNTVLKRDVLGKKPEQDGAAKSEPSEESEKSEKSDEEEEAELSEEELAELEEDEDEDDDDDDDDDDDGPEEEL